MRPVTARLVAVTAVSESAYVIPQTIVAVPPSDLDELGDMRVLIDGVEVIEQYEPELVQP